MEKATGLAGCGCRSESCDVAWPHVIGEPGCVGTGVWTMRPLEPVGSCRTPYTPQAWGSNGRTPLWPSADQTCRGASTTNQSLGQMRWSGALAAPEPTPVVQRIIDEIKSLLDSGTQAFARFMVRLQGVANDFKEARDRMISIGTDEAAIGAYGMEQGYKAAMGVYNALASVFYQAWPDIGLHGPPRGALGVVWLALVPLIIDAAWAIAGIIGAWSLFTWVDTAHQTAAANTKLAEAAQKTCAANPQSPACLDAMRLATKGVPPAPDPLGGAIANLGKVVAWGIGGLLGFKLIEAFTSSRRSAAPAAA